MRALIVDDEPLARSNISALLRRDPQITGIDECESGAAAVTQIRQNKPELLFLDVQMPECDGFDVLERLGGEVPAAVILVTAHDEYALRAFDAGALDYLLKPFDDARFERALTRAKEKIAAYGNRQHRTVDRLMIKDDGQILFLPVHEIDWIEAADYYACLHVGARTHVLRRTLSELESDLDSSRFCRSHRSVIVNLERVRAVESKNDGEYELLLKSGARLRLSRRFRKNLEARLRQAAGLAG